MRQTILFSLFLTLVFAMSCSMSKETARAENHTTDTLELDNSKSETDRNLVLVELFTSEGCSSCPPADRVLERLQKEQPVENSEIVTLAFHVDYWNYLDWKDEFSSPKYSQRQTKYTLALGLRSNYTPQMVVDGTNEFVGSNYSTAISKIKEAGKNKKGNVQISLDENKKLGVKISDLPKHDESEVLLAIVEDNLETNVKRGENKGRKLSHVSVVRDLIRLGKISADKNGFETKGDLELKKEWKKENGKIIIFVQSLLGKEVFAIGKAEIN